MTMLLTVLPSARMLAPIRRSCGGFAARHARHAAASYVFK